VTGTLRGGKELTLQREGNETKPVVPLLNGSPKGNKTSLLEAGKSMGLVACPKFVRSEHIKLNSE